MNIAPKSFASWCLSAALAVCVLGIAATGNAQPPRQLPQAPARVGGQTPSRVDPQVLSRARDACDAAAQRAGYRVLRRDHENVNGRSYDLPLRVAYGTNQGDVTCRYDLDRGLADIPPYDGGRGFGRRNQPGYDQAQRLCENFVNQRRGYHVLDVGTAVQHGRNLWDVPMTVQRNGRRQRTVTCRYNAASNKLSLR